MNKPKNDRTVVKATHDAVVRAADSMRMFKKKTDRLAKEVEKRWKESKPRQERAKKEVQKVARRVVSFGQDVREGLKKGLADAKRAGRG